MLCLSRWGCGAARSCVGGAGLSPLDAHVAVEPELHEAGLQVGVRHVQQHLYDARERSLSERRRCGFPGRQSVPWIRPWPGRRIPTARSPESPRRPDQANVYAPASLKEAAPRHPAPLHLSPRHEISSTPCPCGSSRRQQAQAAVAVHYMRIMHQRLPKPQCGNEEGGINREHSHCIFYYLLYPAFTGFHISHSSFTLSPSRIRRT